ncbi:MAG: hypothetical protein PUB87_00975 [Eubacteriaceae bacterium]|nr:hypothetical protein [Eubacteriaceae bacterium]
MDRTVKLLMLSRWLGLPLGIVMYLGTRTAFGEESAMMLGAIAAAVFVIIMRRGCTRVISEAIAGEIKEAISKVAKVESFIEMKGASRGLIARVYLVGAKEKITDINRMINSRLEDSVLRKHLWIMQLTDMDSRDDLKMTQERLNEQLIEELEKIAKERRKK